MSEVTRNSPGRIRSAVCLGLFAGTAVGLGFLLSAVPNVELVTLTVVLAGAALGPAGGMLAGGLAEACFSLANPLGAALPVLLASQIVGMGAAGFVGGLATPVLLRLPAAGRWTGGALLGFGVTLGFDLLTNLATAVTMKAGVGVVLLAGLPLALVHVGVNTAVFGLLWPVLAPRVRALRRPSLRAGAIAALGLGLAMTSGAAHAQTATADTVVASAPDSLGAPADTVAARPVIPPPLGWQRPLWDPCFSSFVEDLTRRSPWLAVRDGGFGSRVYLAGEPGTSFTPAVLRDGLPLQTGHLYADDLASVAQAGYRIGRADFGFDGWGGTDGVVNQVLDDATPDLTRTDTRFHAGTHKDLMRSVHLLTAAAPWRAQLAIEEHLDVEGYDFRVANETRYDEILDREAANYPGHARFRSGQGMVTRTLEDGSTLAISLENVRKLKSLLPAFDLKHQDLWRQRVVADWRGRGLRAAAFWIDTDVDWDRPTRTGNPPPDRKLETGREGLLLSAGPVTATVSRWDLRDTGADTLWAGAGGGPRRGVGEEASIAGRRAWTTGAVRAAVTLSGWYDGRAGWLPGGAVSLEQPRESPGWRASLERGGRAPRSDELLTVWRFDVPGRSDIVVLPSADLERERTWRLEVTGRRRLLGLDLAASGALRRLEQGIGWRPDSTGALTGRLANDVDLDSRTLRLSASREGRCLGWVRLSAQAAWRDWTQGGEARIALPPEQDWRLAVLWENHLFKEDGIVEVAYYLDHRGAMPDPWYLGRGVDLPAVTLHDLWLGFRLVGTDLGVAFLNLTDKRVPLSAGALSAGREFRWRLHWTFLF